MAEDSELLVGVLMGSKSDWKTMQHTRNTLKEFGVGCECRVLSAHRTPGETVEYVKAAEGRGIEVLIAAAGGAAHLAGVSELSGSYLENLVLGDLNAWRDASEPRAEILFWRTHSGEEVDFLIEVGGLLLPIEVKAARRVTPRDARHLQTFLAEYGDAVLGGLVLYGGEDVFWLAEGILAAPWWKVI